ncbi:class II glutamine amidotransferase [Pseudenhygromyxa sp. WMMC2535]|uniref:class II glutamine amidotransferase n=1 Tax=Pseudenhygromyxa sp. WMMC2535 TaxID=2712867 RepID=UPI001554BE85|nr:class II glutamine amidotransferase [Pseudenhygromyxa sp. WMMC2535]NVB41957.1 class II glutamine amidotransferase [Pseudenhygromyxa sp. WMMC2535]
MCRFAYYLGPPIRLSALVTEPENSLIHQSYDAKEREEPLNGDGFGIGWYVPELRNEPAIFRSISPAWNDVNLLNLAAVTTSPCMLAHVRAATPGLPVTLLNCHPFARGRLAFMHNGAIGSFDRMRRPLQAGLSDAGFAALSGSTDSELIFSVVVDAYAQIEADQPLERMADALVVGIERVEALRSELAIDEPAYLNLVLTDGERAVVSRYLSPDAEPELEAHSLYRAKGRLVVEDGRGHLRAPKAADDPAVVIASEPLGDRERWEAIPTNHLALVEDGAVALRAI